MITFGANKMFSMYLLLNNSIDIIYYQFTSRKQKFRKTGSFYIQKSDKKVYRAPK